MESKIPRTTLLIALTFVSLVPSVCALAATVDCAVGRSDKLTLLSWTAQPGKLGPTITFRLKSNLPKPVRSINATLIFDDAEGNRLAEVPLSPDVRIAAGVEGTEE